MNNKLNEKAKKDFEKVFGTDESRSFSKNYEKCEKI